LSQTEIANISTSCQSAGILGAVAGRVALLQSESVLDYFFGAENQRINALRLKRFRFPDMETRCSETSGSRACPLGCTNRKTLSLNLVEKKCPQTFILSKLALEQINPNQCIEASFGNLDSLNNVISSLRHEGVAARLSGISNKVWRLNLTSMQCN
jgi:TusA-related sulfurtransferase